MTHYLVQAILIGLAAWRVAAFLAYERGPYAIFLRFRERLGFEHDENGEPTVWPGGWREVFSCVWCLSIWTAALFYGVWRLEPLIVVVVAAATVVVIIEKWAHDI